MLRLAAAIDRFTERSALAFAWLIAPLVAVVTWEVVARYAFDAPTVWAYETIYALNRPPPGLDIFELDPEPDERGLYQAMASP